MLIENLFVFIIMENIDKYTRTYDSVVDSRKSFIDKKPKKPYFLFQESGIPEYGNNVIKADFDKDMLNQLFFSKENISQIQNSLRFKIYQLSEGKYTIGNQSETELIIVMRSIYYQHSRNINDKNVIKEQIKNLNQLVVKEISPKILSQIQQYYGYMRDSTKRMDPLPNPENTNLFARRNNNPTAPF